MSFYRKLIKTAAPFIMAYNRVKCHGLGNVPPKGEGCIFTPNHTNWLGWDGMIVNSILRDRKIRWVAWSYGEEFPLMDKLYEPFEPIWVGKKRPFPFDEVSADILQRGDSVGLFPEGNTNPVGKWYRLRGFLPGSVRLSHLSGAPIIPTSIAGLEEASPVLWQNEFDDSPATKALPLPILLPTKVTVRFGEPIYPDAAMKEPFNEDVLMKKAGALQSEVLRLLQIDRPKAYAENRQKQPE